MGKLVATTQATLDGVVDPVGEWVRPDGDHGEYSFERQVSAGGLVLGRKTYEGLAGFWPSKLGKSADMINAMPITWAPPPSPASSDGMQRSSRVTSRTRSPGSRARQR